jgi:nucleoside phosphorylase
MIDQDLKNRVVQIAADLYPLGPTEKSIWRRSGGDLSLLNLSEAGRFAWYSAIDQLDKGGGGENITLESLIGAMLEDFRSSSELQNLAGEIVSGKQISVTPEIIESEKLKYSPEEQPWYRSDFPEMHEFESDSLPEVAAQTDVLIFTATNVELQYALGKTLPLAGQTTILQGVSGNETYFLGRFGAFNAVLTKTRMGTVGAGAATLAAEQALRVWQPRAAFMVGIAFGKDPAKQHIGEVLVASAIIPYEPRRVGSQTIVRGIAMSSDPRLQNRFENALGWNFTLPNGEKCKFDIGQLLSGNQLIDDEQAKKNLFAEFPVAIGGEMEGAGFYAAAAQHRVPALLIKAICDWGDGKKHKAHQPLAAAASVSFLHFVLSQKNTLNS